MATAAPPRLRTGDDLPSDKRTSPPDRRSLLAPGDAQRRRGGGRKVTILTHQPDLPSATPIRATNRCVSYAPVRKLTDSKRR